MKTHPLPAIITRTDNIESIQKIVAEVYSIHVSEISSEKKPENLCRARRTSMFLCHTKKLGSLKFIGKHHGRRDHGTVWHAIRRAQYDMEHIPEFNQKYDECLARAEKLFIPVEVSTQSDWPEILNPPKNVLYEDPRQAFLEFVVPFDQLFPKAS